MLVKSSNMYEKLPAIILEWLFMVIQIVGIIIIVVGTFVVILRNTIEYPKDPRRINNFSQSNTATGQFSAQNRDSFAVSVCGNPIKKK